MPKEPLFFLFLATGFPLMRRVWNKWPFWLLLCALILSACQPHAIQPSSPQTPASQPLLALTLAGEAMPLRNAATEFVITGVPAVDTPFNPVQAELQIVL